MLDNADARGNEPVYYNNQSGGIGYFRLGTDSGVKKSLAFAYVKADLATEETGFEY